MDNAMDIIVSGVRDVNVDVLNSVLLVKSA